jgi:hypothetical protein
MQKFTGKQYLQIDVASNFGLDKEEWNTRLAWFEAHEPHLEGMLDKAKEPALYFAAVQAWRAVQRGEPTGYPISLDATASGLQILAALTGDRKAAELCNVVSTGKREDAYTNIYNYMLDKIQGVAMVSRDQAKEAVMTSLYGSEAVPKRVFGTSNLLATFFETMETLAPAAWELNQAFLTMWNPEALSHDWVLPDNFHVHVKVMTQEKHVVHFKDEPFDIFLDVNAPTDNGRSLGANATHSVDGMIVREMNRRCNYNPARVQQVRDALNDIDSSATDEEDEEMVAILWNHYEQSGYLSARILDHLGWENIHYVRPEVIWELINSLPAKPFEVISVHDCFRCLANYGNDLRIQYNIQLMLLAKSNLLGYLISQIMGRKVSIGKLDPTLYNDIMDTDYALS